MFKKTDVIFDVFFHLGAADDSTEFIEYLKQMIL